MAFRKKYEAVIQLNPDLLIIQECENEIKLKEHLKSVDYNQIIWYGDNRNKGVGVISFNDIQIELNPIHSAEYQYVIPIILRTQQKEINLFCIWAMPHKTNRQKRYVRQIWGAIHYYEKLLNVDSILIGDFNSNTIWDKEYKGGNHSDVVAFLKEKKISSLYHELLKYEHGQEQHPTLYLLKKEDRPYHMDYCFASDNLVSNDTTIQIGNYEEWIKLSDHMPLLIDNLDL